MSMEAFTSGRVSPAARREYVRDHPSMADAFSPVPGGFAMRAWESQIRFARAYGRGVHRATNRPAHPFDALPGANRVP